MRRPSGTQRVFDEYIGDIDCRRRVDHAASDDVFYLIEDESAPIEHEIDSDKSESKERHDPSNQRFLLRGEVVRNRDAAE